MELRDGFLLVFSFSSFKGRRDCRCGRFCAVAFLVVDGDGLVWLVSDADVVNRYALDPGALSFEMGVQFRISSWFVSAYSVQSHVPVQWSWSACYLRILISSSQPYIIIKVESVLITCHMAFAMLLHLPGPNVSFFCQGHAGSIRYLSLAFQDSVSSFSRNSDTHESGQRANEHDVITVFVRKPPRSLIDR